MKNNLKRFKELVKYPLNEEMLSSEDFEQFKIKKLPFKNAIILNVGIDSLNDDAHQLDLIAQLENIGGARELTIHFAVANKNGVYKDNKALYKREDVAKYLPKTLTNQNIFRTIYRKMIKELLIMENKPKRFYMITYDDYQNSTQLSYFNDIVKSIEDNDYDIEKQYKNKENKFVWKFKLKNLTENDNKDNEFEDYTIPREEFYNRINEKLSEISEELRKIND